MRKIDQTIVKETLYIACWTVILSLVMQSVFLLINKWDYTVILGNLLSIVAGVGNFFLLGLTVQNAVTKEQDEAKKLMKLSQMGRMFLLFIICIIGAVVPCFNIFAVLIPLLFPRIAIMLRAFSSNKGNGGGANE